MSGNVSALAETLEDLGVEEMNLVGDPAQGLVGFRDRGEVPPAERVVGERPVGGVGESEVVIDGIGISGGLPGVSDVLQADGPEHEFGGVVNRDPGRRGADHACMAGGA